MPIRRPPPPARAAFLDDRRGATMVEYALILASIVCVLIGVMSMIGTSINANANKLSSAISGAR